MLADTTREQGLMLLWLKSVPRRGDERGHRSRCSNIWRRSRRQRWTGGASTYCSRRSVGCFWYMCKCSEPIFALPGALHVTGRGHSKETSDQ